MVCIEVEELGTGVPARSHWRLGFCLAIVHWREVSPR
jgi:hypothetical protein